MSFDGSLILNIPHEPDVPIPADSDFVSQKSMNFGILQIPVQLFFIVFPAKYPNKPYFNSFSIFVSFIISILGFLFSSILRSENGDFSYNCASKCT